MSSEPAENFSFFQSPLVRWSHWEGQVCTPGVQIYFIFYRHQPCTLKVNFTFVFFPPLQCDLRIFHSTIYLSIFILTSFTRIFSLEIPLGFFLFFFFTLESLKGSHCISQSGCSWWYWQLCCIRELLPNWTTKSAFFPRFCWSFKESVVCAIKFNSWWPQTCKLWGQWIWQLTGLTGKGCAWSMF